MSNSFLLLFCVEVFSSLDATIYQKLEAISFWELFLVDRSMSNVQRYPNWAKKNSHCILFFFFPCWWLEFRHFSPRQSTVRSPEKMTREGHRIPFLDNKSSGSSPEKDLIPKPDTYQLTHDALLDKRLDVGDSSQIHPYQLPSDVGLETHDTHYSQTLSLHGSLCKRPQRNKNYQEYSINPSNDIKTTTSHSCGDLQTALSNTDSNPGRLLKLSSGNKYLPISL